MVSMIMVSFALAIQKKGINVIHPRKEIEVGVSFGTQNAMDIGKMTSNQVGNLSHPRFHGLIARVESGNYCLTRKGARFLKGEPIQKYAIVSKITGHQEGYWAKFGDDRDLVTIKQLLKDDEYFGDVTFDIQHGRVINEIAL